MSVELMTPDEVCRRWGICRKTLSRWIKEGYVPGTREPFPYMKIGRKLRFGDDQVEFIETHMRRAARPVPRRRAS